MTIAGSDSSSGAGIQADLKTFSHFHVHGLTAVTCIVAEVPGRVRSIQAVDVTVVTPGGTSATSSADRFTYTVPNAPTVTSVSPASGYQGTSVAVAGTNFTGASAVNFGPTAAKFRSMARW